MNRAATLKTVEPKFVKEEVWALAEYVADNWRSDGGDHPDFCIHCDVKFNWKTPYDKVVHRHDCLVLVARDILTGKP